MKYYVIDWSGTRVFYRKKKYTYPLVEFYQITRGHWGFISFQNRFETLNKTEVNLFII